MSAIDLDGFSGTPLERDPYDYVIVPGFLKSDSIGQIDADYPRIDTPGSFPLPELPAGPAFTRLVEELQGTPVRRAFSEKFDIDLNGRPTSVTVRGHCQEKDGRIHTDTESKIITVLIYMNTEAWAAHGGRLRILRSADDIDDFAAEVPPQAGTLLAFRRSECSFHGHETYVGERRVIQLNWVTDEKVVRREKRRHRLSSRIKSMLRRDERAGR